MESITEISEDDHNLLPVDPLESLRVWMADVLSLLHDISSVDVLDGIDTDGNKLFPINQLVMVLISQSNHHVDVIVIQSISQCLEGVPEFLVGELATSIFVHQLKHFC